MLLVETPGRPVLLRDRRHELLVDAAHYGGNGECEAAVDRDAIV